MPKIDIDKVVNLASLTLTKSEKDTFEKQLTSILNYVSKLEEIDTEKIEPIGHITGSKNVTREDEPTPSLSQEEATKNAKKIHNGFFEVDAIFEETDF